MHRPRLRGLRLNRSDIKGDRDRDLFFADLCGSDKDKVRDKKCYEDLFELP